MRSTSLFKILHGFLLEFSNSGKCVVHPTSGGLQGWLGAVLGEGGVLPRVLSSRETLPEPEVKSLLATAALVFPQEGLLASPAPLLLIGRTLLGSRVVQAHVLLACSPAHQPPILCHGLGQTAVAKLPLLGGLGGFTRLREVPCGLAGGPGRGAHDDVDAAGRLGVAGVAPLRGRESRNDQSAREAPLAEEEAQGGAGGRAQTGPDQCLGPLADAQVARGGDRWGLRVQGRGRGVQGQPAAREPLGQLVDRRGRLQEGRVAL